MLIGVAQRQAEARRELELEYEAKARTRKVATMKAAKRFVVAQKKWVEVVSWDAEWKSEHREAAAAAATKLAEALAAGKKVAGKKEHDTACEASEWWSETSVRSRTNHGVLGTLRVMLTAGERIGSVNEASKFEIPCPSITTRVNWAGTRSARVTGQESIFVLTTRNTEAIRIMYTACESTEWWSETSVRCRTSHGVRLGTHRVMMTTGERVGTVTEAWSIEIPSISIDEAKPKT